MKEFTVFYTRHGKQFEETWPEGHFFQVDDQILYVQTWVDKAKWTVRAYKEWNDVEVVLKEQNA